MKEGAVRLSFMIDDNDVPNGLGGGALVAVGAFLMSASSLRSVEPPAALPVETPAAMTRAL